MRVFAATAVISLSAVALLAQTSPTGTATPKPAAKSTAAGKSATAATHRPAAAHPPRKAMPEDPKANEGTAAVGTMPAATGTPAPLYTLKFIDLKVGDGEEAKASGPGHVMLYTVHYTGWTTDGTKFDSSVDRGEPITFPAGLHRVIIGWDTGFQGMRVGGKRRLIVPYQLAYGEAGHPPVIPEKADLIFDVELIKQEDASLAAPPAGAVPSSAQPGATTAQPGSSTPAQQPRSNPTNQPAERPQDR